MRTPPPDRSDFFDNATDRQFSINLTLMVVATQLIALGIIFFAILILRKPSWPHRKFDVALSGAVIGGFFLAIWGIYCWSDIAQRFRQYRNRFDPLAKVAVAKRKTHILKGTFFLIIADTLLLAFLIGITGGLGNSPLDPLLPAIPIIAIILRQPYRTIMWSLSLGLISVSLFVGLRLPSIHLLILQPILDSHPSLMEYIYDSHQDPNYYYALGLVAFGAIGLTLVEYLVANPTPEILKNIPDTVGSVLGDRGDALHLAPEIKKGARNWIKWLSIRGLPLKDLSIVHDEPDVIKQAVVLCIPHWIDGIWKPEPEGWLLDWIWQWTTKNLILPILRPMKLDKLARRIGKMLIDLGRREIEPYRNTQELRRKKLISRRITFLTLAAHWVDDHFDAIEENCQDPKEREEVLNKLPEQLLRGQHLRLNEVIHGMEKSAVKENRLHIRHAVQRIIFGGLIQNAESKKRLDFLCSEYLAFVTQKLISEEIEAYKELSKRPLTLLLTAKVVMELLDSASACENSATLIKKAEFFNLLYSPILYYHDCDKELSTEKYGAAFQDDEGKQNYLPTPTELIAIIERCKTLLPIVFATPRLSKGRSLQLELLIKMYDKQLPEMLRAAYEEFLVSHGTVAFPIH
jgi:hypothetical protein